MKKKLTFFIAITLTLLPALTNANTLFKVNRDYGSIYAVAVPQEFSLSYNAKNAKLFKADDFSGTNIYAKLLFLNPNGNVSENLYLSYFKIPLTPNNERIKSTKKLLITELSKISDATPDKTVEIKIAEYPAIAILAKYDVFYVALIAIINPKSHHSILAQIIITPGESPATGLEKILTDSLSIKTLNTFKYGRELM